MSAGCDECRRKEAVLAERYAEIQRLQGELLRMESLGYAAKWLIEHLAAEGPDRL